MSEHTPGPWQIQSVKATGELWVSQDEHTYGDMAIAIAAMVFGGRKAMLSDARLIAAAPELLEAAEAVMEWARTPGEHGGNPYCKEFVRLAENAITKATGEPGWHGDRQRDIPPDTQLANAAAAHPTDAGLQARVQSELKR